MQPRAQSCIWESRSCQCDADMLAAKLVEQPWDAVRLEGQLAEQTEVLAEAAAEVELIKGCDWNCYLDRYPKIRNEKWEQEKGNQDYARSHYLKFGRVAGKNCKCGPGPKNLITGASLLQLPILVEQEADESQQVVQQEMTVSTQQKPNYSWGKRFTHMCSRYRAASNAFEEYTMDSGIGRRILNTRHDS